MTVNNTCYNVYYDMGYMHPSLKKKYNNIKKICATSCNHCKKYCHYECLRSRSSRVLYPNKRQGKPSIWEKSSSCRSTTVNMVG